MQLWLSVGFTCCCCYCRCPACDVVQAGVERPVGRREILALEQQLETCLQYVDTFASRKRVSDGGAETRKGCCVLVPPTTTVVPIPHVCITVGWPAFLYRCCRRGGHVGVSLPGERPAAV